MFQAKDEPFAAALRANHEAVPAYPLDISGEGARSFLDAVGGAVTGILGEMEGSPAVRQDSDAAFLTSPLVCGRPDEGPGNLADLLDAIRTAGRIGINTANGRALAYMPGSGLLSSAAADLLSGVINAYTGVSMTAPAMVAMEHTVLRWLADLVDLPASAGGMLSSGGSISTLSALLCAKVDRDVRDPVRARLYVTEETHHCVAKAASLIGFGAEAIRHVATDTRLRMDPAALETMIAEDRAAGLHPFCIVGNAGTTSTGSIDPLGDLAGIARRHAMWFHVDAAYGGFFQLTARGREAMAGIGEADSVVLDPHKSLFLPYGTGALVVRDEAILKRAHTVEGGAYLRDLDDVGQDFADISPELSRPNRGLRIWLPLHLHGVAAFRAALDEKLDLASVVRDRLERLPRLDVHPGSDLSVVAFRCAAEDPAAADRLTDEVVRRVNATGEIFLATTRLKGRVHARVAVLGLRTTPAIVERALDLIEEAVAELAQPAVAHA